MRQNLICSIMEVEETLEDTYIDILKVYIEKYTKIGGKFPHLPKFWKFSDENPWNPCILSSALLQIKIRGILPFGTFPKVW